MTKRLLFAACLVCFFLAGCAPEPTATPTLSATPENTATPEPTLTPTPLPSVAVVNGIYIPEEDLARETENLIRAASDLGTGAPEDARSEALDGLIDQALLIAYARDSGYVSDPEAIDARIQTLVTAIGGEGAFQDWQRRNGYTAESFRRALDAELAVAFAREKLITEALPQVEQIHAYQILTDSKSAAQGYLDKLALGFDFVSLARTEDTISGGDLDWIARGVLVYPELEDALFALGTGETTPILETELGFHLLYAAERSTDRPLSQQVRETVERLILSNWLEAARGSADLQRLD